MRIVYGIPVAPADIEQASLNLAQWKNMGYETLVVLNHDSLPPFPLNADIVLHFPSGLYPGWATCVNKISKCLPDVDWLVGGGADMLPDPLKAAAQIAAECVEHFGGTYGVMQPCGDPYGALADRSACVSPWWGREWRETTYGGKGPQWPEYLHFYSDTELAQVAGRIGRLWWRPDLTQYHNHYLRRREPVPSHHQLMHERVMQRGETDKALFERRKAEGFPGF